MNGIKWKIVVIDKSGPYLEGLVDLLRELGYNVDYGSDAAATYQKLKHSVRPVELLIIDLQCIEEVDGFLFLTRVKKVEFCQRSKIIVTTDSSLDERLGPARNELAIL
ncbi:MAG: hypothetical protein ACREBC_38700, partial [Pyrinomonadaceae bacterium]